MKKTRRWYSANLLASAVVGGMVNTGSATAQSAREICIRETGYILGHTIDACNEAIHQNPNEPWPYIGRGRVFNNAKDYDKAIADFNEAIRLDPKIANAYANRGLAWNGKREFDKAIADLEKAINLDLENSLAFYGRSMAWWNKGEYSKWVSDYYESVKLDTIKLGMYIQIGFALLIRSL